MRLSILILSAVLLAATGCGTGRSSAPQRADVDAFFTLPMAIGGGATPSPPQPGEQRAYTVETRFVRSGGDVLMAPRLTVYPRQRANVSIVNQTSFVQNFEVEVVDGASIADPIIGILQDGLTLELCVDRDGDEIAVAYRVHVADLLQPIPQRNVTLMTDSERSPLTIQLPALEIGETAGVRRVVSGTVVRLARLATRSGDVDVLMRVDEVGLPPVGADEIAGSAGAEINLTPASDGADAVDVFTGASVRAPDFPAGLLGAADSDLLAWLDASGDDLRLEIEPIVLDHAVGSGQVLDVGAAEAFGAARTPALRRLALSTRVVAGAAVRSLLQESLVQDFDVLVAGTTVAREAVIGTVRSGFSAELDDAGTLRLTWATMPEVGRFETDMGEGPPVAIDLPARYVKSVTMRPTPGDWLVTFGRTGTSGTLAARVRIVRVQRRVASQTHATR